MADNNSSEMESEIAKLKKLSPEERIHKLKEIEERRKTEKNDMEKLLEESIIELKKEETIKEIEVPESKKVEFEKLFSNNEENELEKKAAEGKKSDESRNNNTEYKIGLDKAEEIYEDIRELGYTNSWKEEQFREFYKMESLLENVNTRLLKDEVAERVRAGRNLVNIIRNYIR